MGILSPGTGPDFEAYTIARKAAINRLARVLNTSGLGVF
jgi:hypothetical protein